MFDCKPRFKHQFVSSLNRSGPLDTMRDWLNLTVVWRLVGPWCRRQPLQPRSISLQCRLTLTSDHAAAAAACPGSMGLSRCTATGLLVVNHRHLVLNGVLRSNTRVGISLTHPAAFYYSSGKAEKLPIDRTSYSDCSAHCLSMVTRLNRKLILK